VYLLIFTAVSMDVLLSILQHSVLQLLQWPLGNICVLPLVISWWYRLTASVRTVVALLLSLARWRGMHYWHSYVVRMSLLLLLDDFWRLLCSRSTDVLSALEAFATRHYTNRHFTLHYITLLLDTVQPSLQVFLKWPPLSPSVSEMTYTVSGGWVSEWVVS